MVAIAAVSFEFSRAESRFGSAMAATIAMITITIINSMSVNPLFLECMDSPYARIGRDGLSTDLAIQKDGGRSP